MPSEVEPILHRCKHCSVLIDVSEVETFATIGCPNCNANLRVRSRFNNFELLEVIASGGMGTVYKAHDVSLNRIVALKLLRKEFSADQEYIRKLETEARITASVNHPYVVKVFSFGSEHGQYYIAMELVEQGSLDDLMVRQRRIPEAQVLEIGIQVALGLRAALEVGLIHRDVKPGNILLADAHTAKIVDFGLALPADQGHQADEELWGTPFYVPPEKLENKPEDFRSDIYSLGSTLFHALAGKPPFKAANASVDALKLLKSQPVSLQAAASDISSTTAYVINRTMSHNPEDRHRSYDELLEHLEYARAQLLKHGPGTRQAQSGQGAKSERSGLSGYIKPAVAAFLLTCVIALLFHKDESREGRASADAAPAETAAQKRDENPEVTVEATPVAEPRVAKTADTGEAAYGEARRLLVSGEVENAMALFKQLEERKWVGQPQKNWAIFLEGLAAYLNNSAFDGRNAFERLRDAGLYSTQERDARLANFFVEVGRSMAGDEPLGENITKIYVTPEFEPLALIAFALKSWDASQFDRAAAFFRSFNASAPEGKWQWIENLKPLANRYLADYDAYRAFEIKTQDAKTPQAKAALLPLVGSVKAKLQLPGKLAEKLDAFETEFKSAAGGGQ